MVSFPHFDNGGRLVLLPDGRFDGDELGMEYLRLFERGTLVSLCGLGSEGAVLAARGGEGGVAEGGVEVVV